MSKYGKLIAIGATTLLAAAGTLSAGIFMSSARESSMAADGYVLSSDWQSTQSEKSGSEETAPESYYFSGGTKVRGKFPNELVFHDVEGTKRSVGKESFLHYADGSASALSDGVLVNLDDINTGLVNHYGVEKNTVIAASSGGFSVENNGNEISFNNFIWKIGDDRFMLYSNGASLHLPSGEEIAVDGWIEAEYPEQGIICLADENHQYQVVADGTYITLGNGVRYDFGDQIISDAQGNSRMTFQEMLLNADDNIQVQSAEDWVAPEFKFDVIDGQS